MVERRRDLARLPEEVPDSAFSAPAISRLVVCSAGTKANIRVETRQTPALNASTRQSIWPDKFVAMTDDKGKKITSRFRQKYATTSPLTEERTERMRPSVRSCLNNLPRLQPMASRTVISCWRAKDLTSSKLLTFAQAIRRTKNTATREIPRVGASAPAWLNGVFHKGKIFTPRPRLVSAYSFSSRFATVESSDCACSMLTPGLRRAKPSIQVPPRSSGWQL